MVAARSEKRRPHRAARWAGALAAAAGCAAAATRGVIAAPRSAVAATRVAIAAALTAALTATVTAAVAADFQCAALKPSESKQPAYARAANQPRCEGFYDRNVSQPFIELVSLTSAASPPAAPAAEAPTLQLTASPRAAARLTVHPLRPAPFYRVDALVAAGQSIAWDAAPMLAATGLRVRDLGFLALVSGGAAPDSFVPVAVSAGGTVAAALPAAPPVAPAALQAVLRVSVPVASLAWRRQRLDGRDDGAGAWREIPGPARFAWERVPFPLEMSADGRGVRVDVQALDAQGKVLPLLSFDVSGPADAGS
jgi:hypothetical protein